MTRTDVAASESARRAARQLLGEFGPGLLIEVEHALKEPCSTRQPPQYGVEPVSIGMLVVMVAQFAWDIYTRHRTEVDRMSVAREVRKQLEAAGVSGTSDQVIEVVINATIDIRNSDS